MGQAASTGSSSPSRKMTTDNMSSEKTKDNDAAGTISNKTVPPPGGVTEGDAVPTSTGATDASAVRTVGPGNLGAMTAPTAADAGSTASSADHAPVVLPAAETTNVPAQSTPSAATTGPFDQTTPATSGKKHSLSPVSAATATNPVVKKPRKATPVPGASVSSAAPVAPATTAAGAPPTGNNKPSAINQLLQDYPGIQQLTRDTVYLLQLYGPLTFAQLEHNVPLPKMPPHGNNSNPSQVLHDILQVLVCLELVQMVDDSDDDNNNNNNRSSRATAPTAPTSPAHGHSPANNVTGGPDSALRSGSPLGQGTATPLLSARPTAREPRYSMLGGIPRYEVVPPTQIMDDVRAAHLELDRSQQRTLFLQQVLQHQPPKQAPKQTLQQLLLDFPEIVQDPVYLTALKNCHVDLAAVDRERRQRRAQKLAQQQHAAAAAAAAVAADGRPEATATTAPAAAATTATTSVKTETTATSTPPSNTASATTAAAATPQASTTSAGSPQQQTTTGVNITTPAT